MVEIQQISPTEAIFNINNQKNGETKMPIVKTMTPVFRVSFPQVFEAKAMPGSTKKKFSLTMLFNVAEINKDPKQKKLWADMGALAKVAIADKWPKDAPKNLQNPFRRGEEKEQYQGYGPGVIFVSATTTTKPGLVDQSCTRIIEPADFYAGCYAQATVNAYAWEYMGKTGVSFGLQNIQKVKDGEPFGGRTMAEDDFNAVSEESVSKAEDSTDPMSMLG